MPATVVLHHELPADHPLGPSHYDWMFDPGGDNEHRLITFRIEHPPTPDQSNPIAAHRLPPHRAAYLTYGGPVSNNRGTVSCIARGSCTVRAHSASLFEADVAFPDWSATVHASHRAGAAWEIALCNVRPTASPD